MVVLLAALVAAPGVASADGGSAPQLLALGASPKVAQVNGQVTVDVSADTGLRYVYFQYSSSGGGGRTPQWNPGGATSSSFSNIRVSAGEAGVTQTLQSVSLTANDGTVATYFRDGSVATVPAGAPGPTIHAVDFSAADWSVAPTEPNAPLGVAASPGDGTVHLTWTAPADHGAAIQSYTITRFPGGASTVIAAPATAATIDGLDNGTPYYFDVIATNAVGESGAATSNTVTPGPGLGAPTPPQHVTARAGVNRAKVTWEAPSSDGGAEISGYRVTSTPEGRTCQANGTARACVVTGLTNGQPYTFAVAAMNNSGTSAPGSSSSPVTPQADTKAPVLVSSTVSPSRVSASTGGTVTVELRITDDLSGVDASAQYVLLRNTTTSQQVGFGAVSRVSGDEYDGVYRRVMSVPAGSANGTWVLSIYPLKDLSANTNSLFISKPGITVGTSSAPTNVTAVAGDGRGVDLSWAAPTDNGGNVITGYQVTDSYTGNVHTLPATATTWAGTFSGIPDTTPLSFTVAAVNAAGTGAPATSAPVTVPALAPTAPRNVQAGRGDHEATVMWDEPASTNGSVVSGYTVTAQPGGATQTVDGATRRAVIRGLANGTAYTFTVTATNSAGTATSAPTGEVTPAGVPDAPASVTAVASDGSVTLAWEAPDSNGSPVFGYQIYGAAQVRTAPGGATSWTLRGLENGRAYTFTISASNEAGESPVSAPTAPVIPKGAPGTPTARVTRGDRRITVTWTSANPNGSPVTGYEVAYGSGTRTVPASARTLTITRLTNGKAYPVTVAAMNAIGTGRPSASVAATPAGRPGKVVRPTARVSGSTITLAWGAASANGSPVTAYTITGGKPKSVTVRSSTRGYTFKNMTKGRHQLRVTARNAMGASAAAVVTVKVT